MKLIAKVSFIGKVSAGMGQNFECSNDVAKHLINAGYAIEEKNDEKGKEEEKEDESKPSRTKAYSAGNQRGRKTDNK